MASCKAVIPHNKERACKVKHGSRTNVLVLGRRVSTPLFEAKGLGEPSGTNLEARVLLCAEATRRLA